MPVSTIMQPNLDITVVNRQLEGAGALEIVRWAADQFGDRLAMTSSFGAQSAVMLHLVTRVAPKIPVIFIDTGFLFPETYRFADELTKRLDLNLKVYQSPISPARMAAVDGPLWEQGLKGLEQYDQIRKVEPMQRAIREIKVTAWLAGLRRQQTQFRNSLSTLGEQAGVYKVLPILTWTTKDVHEYLKKHDLPYHPLHEKGYVSIGDWHSTRSLTDGDANERDTRFRGLKQECGIHLPATAEENQSRESSAL